MATITQTIPNYNGGISQQPDDKKLPGQVVDAVNVLPDVTLGLQKRPGAKLIASLSDGTNNSYTTGRWFHYYRDENEQYIGQVIRRDGHADDGKVRMWRCSDGTERTVTYKSGEQSDIEAYLKHSADDDIQTLTLNDYTYLTNRTIATEMSGSTAPVAVNQAFINLDKISYARQYTLNIFNNTDLTTVTTATRIKVDLISSSNNYCDSGGNIPLNRSQRRSQNTVCGAGVLTDSRAPNVATEILNVTSGATYTDDEAPTGGIDKTYHTREDIFHIFPDPANAVTGVTWTRADSNAAITCTKTDHGYAADDYLDINFEVTSGTGGTDGIYKIISKTDDTFVVTDHRYGIGGEVGASGNATVNKAVAADAREDLYLQVTNIGQSIPTGSGSAITYFTRYTTTHDLLHGGNGWLKNDYFFVWIKDGLYRVTIDEVSTAKVQANIGLIRPVPTPFDTETVITAESVLGDIRTEILAKASSTFADADVQIIGNGIYLTDASNFNVTAGSNELMTIMTDSIQDVADLPAQCKHGYVVKIRNSEAQEDDYYLKFVGDNDRDGRGTWEECPKPGRKISFNAAKMPVQLVRQGDTGNFELSKIDWQDCLVGDNVTVPKPSFISTTDGDDGDTVTASRYINKLVFFRNRLVILSDEDVIMSQPGEFFNFWPKSAITYTVSDRIDLSVSSEYPAIIYDGIQVNAGLLLFTKNQQFMLTTDSDVLSPQTAKINALSAYNFNFKSNPISLGTTIGFLDNAGKHTRFWEMANILREGEPQVVDQTRVVNELFNNDLNKISNSRENSLIFFSVKNSDTLYGFSYFSTSERRLQQAWFKWTFTGTIQHHCVLDDSLYVVIRTNDKDTMQRLAIKTDANTITITDDRDTDSTDDDLVHRVHLDCMTPVTIGASTYNASTKETTFPIPTGFNDTGDSKYGDLDTTTLAIYDNSAGSGDSDPIGQYSKVKVSGSNLIVKNDWSSNTVILGYLYQMKVEFPTIYVTQTSGEAIKADINSSLVVHRVKLNFGSAGMYTTKLERIGKPDYSETWEPPIADEYKGNAVGVGNVVTQTVPTYENNKTLSLTLTSDHPAPATLYSMSWEGEYNSPYYRRV